MRLGPNQQKWVDALRSGEFEQDKEYLQTTNGYCCLGVACVIGERNGIKTNRENGVLIGGCLDAQLEIKDWLGLKSDIGKSRCMLFNGFFTLVGLNDAEYGFKTIADIIEQNADNLFVESK